MTSSSHDVSENVYKIASPLPEIAIMSKEVIKIDQLEYQVMTLSCSFFIWRVAMFPPADITVLTTYRIYIRCAILTLFDIFVAMLGVAAAPSSITRAKRHCRKRIQRSKGGRTSSSMYRAITTVIGGTKFDMTMMTIRGMYLVPMVLMILAHAPCSARKISALLC